MAFEGLFVQVPINSKALLTQNERDFLEAVIHLQNLRKQYISDRGGWNSTSIVDTLYIVDSVYRIDTLIQIIEKEVDVKLSPEQLLLNDFQRQIQSAHRRVFDPFDKKYTEIADEETYRKFQNEGTEIFYQAKRLEDSLINVFLTKNPSLELDYRRISEAEMSASMSKRLALQRQYINSIQ